MTRRLNLSVWADTIKGGALPIAILLLVMLMIVPVPAMLLDVGFILNIMNSLAVLMVAMNVAKPLDFSAFPTVLLLATLFRLALNVASTRVVLVDGHLGPAAAGHVIEWHEIAETAPITLELGYGLVSLVDERKGAPLMGRVTAIRRQLSREFGFVLPMVGGQPRLEEAAEEIGNPYAE